MRELGVVPITNLPDTATVTTKQQKYRRACYPRHGRQRCGNLVAAVGIIDMDDAGLLQVGFAWCRHCAGKQQIQRFGGHRLGGELTDRAMFQLQGMGAKGGMVATNLASSGKSSRDKVRQGFGHGVIILFVEWQDGAVSAYHMGSPHVLACHKPGRQQALVKKAKHQ